jgi:hypothetical protein
VEDVMRFASFAMCNNRNEFRGGMFVGTGDRRKQTGPGIRRAAGAGRLDGYD